MAKISGTKEWAASNVNILRGCEHNCRYCYAAEMNRRFRNQRFLDGDWEYPQLLMEKVTKGYAKRKGTVMYPTTHDITARFLKEHLVVLKKLLAAGNQVLIVSKPSSFCISAIAQAFPQYRNQILFRFTIGAKSNRILTFWEPNAPLFQERVKALRVAHKNDFRTSISIEPMLDPKNVADLVKDLRSYVSDSIWIGKMNHIRKRVQQASPAVLRAIENLEREQTDEKIMKIYEDLKGDSIIKWKESIKEVVGIELAQEKGMDI